MVAVTDVDADALRFWLALHRAPLIGNRRFHRLLAHFGTPRAVFAAGRPVWEALNLPARSIDYLAKPDWARVDADLAWLAAGADRRLLTLAHPEYPTRLREVDDPPALLFVTGQAAALAGPLVAVVGSRSPTPAGLKAARELSQALAAAGIGVVSGLAVGIDAAAHQGALAGGGATLAVAGTGPDQVYPRYHAKLAAEIVVGGGALVSEYPPGTGPLAANFPRRNRIISGLSHGTLVVEAALRSGSLITARLALEQGRDVFAVPGSIYSPQACGCNALIQQGAKLVQTVADILEELPAGICLRPDPGSAGESGAMAGEPSGILKYIAYEPVTVDTLVAATGLSADRISTELLELELQGAVNALPGGAYIRAE